MINSFEGKFAFLSNFFDAEITHNRLTYPNNEAAFQAQKTLNMEERKRFTNPTLTPGQSKRLGRKVQLRSDWETIKDQVMYEVCLAKFTQHEYLANRLISMTHDEELVEGNWWHDTYWGVCNGVGQNSYEN